MPHQDGYFFIQAVKADPPLSDIPFVFLSSTASPSVDEQKAIDLGANLFLKRPLRPEALIAGIEACLQGQTVK